jgi:hypothetical protein
VRDETVRAPGSGGRIYDTLEKNATDLRRYLASKVSVSVIRGVLSVVDQQLLVPHKSSLGKISTDATYENRYAIRTRGY